MDLQKIGLLISEQRKQKNLTQLDLAEKMQVSVQAVSKWERGKSFPEASKLLELSTILGISVNELISGEKINEEKYKVTAESNLIKMQKKSEQLKRYKYYSYIFDFVLNVLLFAGFLRFHLGVLNSVFSGKVAYDSLSVLITRVPLAIIVFCGAGIIAETIYYLQERYAIINFMVENTIVVSIGFKVVWIVSVLVVTILLGGSRLLEWINMASGI